MTRELSPVTGRGRLLFHECLGRGGYGEVYRCTWVRDDVEHVVAVKVLNASVARGSDAQRRLKDEARLLGALSHPGVVRVHDLVEVQGNVAMITEYIAGHDLDHCVHDGLPVRPLVEVIGRVAAALGAAWSDSSPVTGRPLRLVHRDCKPENVRITPHGEVKLLDFGVARAAELRREAQTATNTVMGSYRYMAPERFDADTAPHPSLDVYALGCILYEGLTGERLFEDQSMRDMLVLSIPDNPRYEALLADRATRLPAELDPGVGDLLARLLQRDPARRPSPQGLAILCGDLADRLGGPRLRDWCREQTWPAHALGPGSWTGRTVPVETDASGAFSLDDSDYVALQDLPTEGLRAPDPLQVTHTDTRRVSPLSAPPYGPAFAPTDLASGPSLPAPGPDADAATDAPTDPSRAKLAARAAAQVRAAQAHQDASARTQAVDMAALRAEVLAVSAARAAAASGLDPVPLAPAAPSPPAGPEIHRAAHEARMRAYAAERSPLPARSPRGGIAVHLLLIGGLGLLGVITLIAWALAL